MRIFTSAFLIVAALIVSAQQPALAQSPAETVSVTGKDAQAAQTDPLDRLYQRFEAHQ